MIRFTQKAQKGQKRPKMWPNLKQKVRAVLPKPKLIVYIGRSQKSFWTGPQPEKSPFNFQFRIFKIGILKFGIFKFGIFEFRIPNLKIQNTKIPILKTRNWKLKGLFQAGVRFENFFGTYLCRLSTLVLEVQSYLIILIWPHLGYFLPFLCLSELV